VFGTAYGAQLSQDFVRLTSEQNDENHDHTHQQSSDTEGYPAARSNAFIPLQEARACRYRCIPILSSQKRRSLIRSVPFVSITRPPVHWWVGACRLCHCTLFRGTALLERRGYRQAATLALREWAQHYLRKHRWERELVGPVV